MGPAVTYGDGGGGGLLTDGGTYSNVPNGGGKAFITGGAGGSYSGFPSGGFGGGGIGSAQSAGGGGGGYSGGGAGGSASGVGGGGGSYNAGTNSINTTGINSGNGVVIITLPCTPFTATLSSSGTLTCAQTSVQLTAGGGVDGATYVFSAQAQNTSPTSATATATMAIPYSVTVTNPGGCSSTATTTVMSNTAAPTVSIVGLSSAYCQDAAAVTLAGTGNPTGGAFTIDGLSATIFNPAKLPVGQHTVVYSYTNANANGCSNTTSQVVTVKEVPQMPTIMTQGGGSYPAGQSSLTISQNTGNVILGVSGCAGGTITWSGGNSTILSVSTTNTGVFTYTATCTSKGCTSPTATATVTVVAPTLKVFSRDPDNGQLSSNTIKPYLLLQNVGNTPIPYSTIKVRYYLTTENNIPLLFQKNYVAIGQTNVQIQYVPLATPLQGATGYIEYSFSGGAGSLAPMSNSGPIETQINKQNYTTFNQLDDYSYVNNWAFTLNPRITAYQNGVIFYGMEPGAIMASPRQGVEETQSRLQVNVLGNPVVGQTAQVEIRGAEGQSVQLEVTDLQGRSVHQQRIPQAGAIERVSVPMGNTQSILLLQVDTQTQRQQIKLLKH